MVLAAHQRFERAFLADDRGAHHRVLCTFIIASINARPAA